MAVETKYKVLLDGKDVTDDISNSLKSLSYTDNVEGESDDVEIELENAAGIWAFEWYPEKGMQLQVWIYDDDDTELTCGIFEIDEVEGTGGKDGGDTVTIKGIGAGIKDGIRTINNSAHENKSLREIAATIAARYGMKVQGNVPNVRIGRITQYRTTDLQFLSRIAAEYGIVFSIRQKTMTFTSMYELEEKDGVYLLQRNQIIYYRIKDTTAKTYLQARTSYHIPGKKKAVSFRTSSGEVVNFQASVKNDFLIINPRIENAQQAELKAKAAIYRANTLQQEGNIVTKGKSILVSGINITVEQLGFFSGKYHIVRSTHRVTKQGGYETDMMVKRVGLVVAEQMKKKTLGL